MAHIGDTNTKKEFDMNKNLARFLTTSVSEYVTKHRENGMSMSSYECELMERCFMRGDFVQIEIYLSKKFPSRFRREDED